MNVTSLSARVAAFLDGTSFAVAGASNDPSKYGNIVLRALMSEGLRVVPVNPSGGMIEGLEAAKRLADLSEPVHGLSIVTPPPITEQIVEEAAAAGIQHIWMQPGAESPKAIARGHELGLSVIGGDACILVELGATH